MEEKIKVIMALRRQIISNIGENINCEIVKENGFIINQSKHSSSARPQLNGYTNTSQSNGHLKVIRKKLIFPWIQFSYIFE